MTTLPTPPTPPAGGKKPAASAALGASGLAATSAISPALALSGITPQVVATWNPTLLRTPRVLVPIELSALMVRDGAASWARCGMQTPPAPTAAAPKPVAAETLKPPPFANLDAPRARGAYLHWYLPNGLTSGTSDATSKLPSFPAIPDRWLVVRLSGGQSGERRAVRGWVLEAGVDPPVAHDLAAWTEPTKPPALKSPLTALGHGDLAWAGYFDNVENRLGFQDATLDADKVQGPIAYLVCGWYSDPTLDPLGAPRITSYGAFQATMSGLAWGLDTAPLAAVTLKAQEHLAAATQANLAMAVHPSLAAARGAAPPPWWPAGCVLHGAVVGISWPNAGDTVEVGGPPAATAITVAIGNTLGETLAALVARANGSPDEAAVVEALQLGVIAELDAPDGRAQLDAQLHASSFIALPGGAPATEPIKIAPSGPPQPPAPPPAPAGTAPPAALQGPTAGGLATSVLPSAAARPRAAGLVAVDPAPTGVTTGASSATAGLAVDPAASTVLRGETSILAGGLREAITALGAGVTVPPVDPGGEVDALRAPPRRYLPKDPVVLVQGGARAFVHDSSVHTEDGILQCRLAPVTALSWLLTGVVAGRLSVGGADILAAGIDNGSVPVECTGLLLETALLDPGAAPAIVGAVGPSVPPAATAAARRNVTVEQTVWYALRDPRVDHAPLLARSGITGMLPAAFAIAPASLPWTPLHLDWTVEYVPSPQGIADWQLGEIDFALKAGATVPAAGKSVLLSGQSTLTGGAAAGLASAVRNAMAQAARVAGTAPIAPVGREAFFSLQAQQLTARFQALAPAPAAGAGALSDIATALGQMDVLSCGLNGFLTQLRGGVPGDGTVTAPVGAVPSPFFALRGGFLRVIRLRLVDGYGQFVDLCGSDATHPAQGVVVSAPLAVSGAAGVAGLAPRWTAAARLTFRFMSADQAGVEANATTSPVCGFLMPNHLDGSLELFHPDGSNAGMVQPRADGRVIWQAAPGSPTAAGQDPGAMLPNAHAAALARSLVDWGIRDAGAAREPALAALLRIIDSTRWAVDPYAHAGDEHLALLLGHPVCVLRALLRLEVDDPVTTPDNTLTAVPVRLGALAHWQDGLFGYFANDDYRVLHVADAAAAGMARPLGPRQGFLQPINAVPAHYAGFAADLAALPPGSTTGATPVSHPYIDTSGIVWIRPHQTVQLTLLVEPLATVHATAGLVPRKEIGMRRAWVQDALAAIAPTFQFGPVLVDPQQIRMPLATDLNGTWVWDYRSDPTKWTEDPATNSTGDALLSRDPAVAIEGWLRLVPPKTGATS